MSERIMMQETRATMKTGTGITENTEQEMP